MQSGRGNMTDFDADEPVKPPKRDEPRRFWTSDRIIGYSGVVLAMSAAFFPWYVFFSGARPATEVTASFLARNLPDWAGRDFFGSSPNDSVSDKAADRKNAPVLPEQIITGTVPGLDKAEAKEAAEEGAEQPLPAKPQAFHLLHVSRGQAMIEDASGVYVVKVGSKLPDLSTVATLEQRDGEWVIVTDKGDVYDSLGRWDRE